jgi:hypothetical protein
MLGQSALGETVRAGNLIATIEGGVSPHKLPRTTPAPITLKAIGSLRTSDGCLVPPLKTLTLEFDKHGHLYTKGLATCSADQLGNSLASQAIRICGKALVGTERVSAEIAFPEQQPFSASGPLLIFNGQPNGGKPVVILFVYALVPAPTTFITTGAVSKASGQYGTSVFIKIPTIVGGYGSVTSADITIHKTWTSKGEKKLPTRKLPRRTPHRPRRTPLRRRHRALRQGRKGLYTNQIGKGLSLKRRTGQVETVRSSSSVVGLRIRAPSVHAATPSDSAH